MSCSIAAAALSTSGTKRLRSVRRSVRLAWIETFSAATLPVQLDLREASLELLRWQRSQQHAPH
jgi:hypothetical protein